MAFMRENFSKMINALSPRRVLSPGGYLGPAKPPVKPDCFIHVLHLTQNVHLRDDDIPDGTLFSILDDIPQDIPKTFAEYKALEFKVYQIYQEEGEIFAHDDWTVLEGACNSTYFLKFNSSKVVSGKFARKFSRKFSKKFATKNREQDIALKRIPASEGASKQDSEEDSDNSKVCLCICKCCIERCQSLIAHRFESKPLTGSARLGDIDVPYSLDIVEQLLNRGKSHDDKNELREAFIYYSLAFHLSKLLMEEVQLTFADKAKLLIANYNIFRILCNIEPHRTAQIQTEWAKYVAPPIVQSKMAHIELPSEQASKDAMDAAIAMKRVHQQATITKPQVSLSQVIGQIKAIRSINANLSKNTNHVYKIGEFDQDHHKQRGMLLYGPPGNGKTLMAMAAASAAKDVTYISMGYSDIISKWKGAAENTLRALFLVASQNTPALVFIDEVDQIVTARKDGEEEDSNAGIVTTMLVECQRYPGVFVIAATNKPWRVDEAFYRRLIPVYVTMPTEDDRYEFLRRKFLNLRSLLTNDNLKDLAKATSGFSFDDLNNFTAKLRTINEENTRDSLFFKKTFNNFDGTEQYCACKDKDPNSIPTSINDLPAISWPPITLKEVCATMHHVKPTNSRESLKLYEQFQKDAMDGFQKFLNEHKAEVNGKDEHKNEFYTGFNKDLKEGKFNQTRESELFKYKVPGLPNPPLL